MDRVNKFIPDPLVPNCTDAGDFKGGSEDFDRGHLAPAGDMLWDSTAMKESFYYSNMSPQRPAFNQHIWGELESYVRAWAKTNAAIYVATGPVLKKGLPKTGHHNVSVPEYYYKVILDYTDPEKKAIGFLMKNEGSTLPVESFAVSVDSVEKVTGLDFFAALPDDEEKVLESKIDLSKWYFHKQKGRRKK